MVGVDHNWRPTTRWNVRTRLIGSHIEETGATARDTGATIWADYEMDGGWRQQWIGMHFGNDLEINDAGYLARNSTNYLHWQINRRFTDLPAESRYASKDWRGRVSTDYNDHGQRLGNQVRISSIPSPGSTVWLFDNGRLAAVAQQNNVHSNLHSAGANFTFLDGHSARFRNKDYWNFSNDTGLTNNPNLIWIP